MKKLITTIDIHEVNRFSALSDDWWKKGGAFAPLHRLTPVRMKFLRNALKSHQKVGSSDERPFCGMKILDVGCGGGLLTEPVTRLGGTVTGIDASREAIGAAVQHSKLSGLEINYLTGEVATAFKFGEKFDVVIASEILEHVLDPRPFIAELTKLMTRDGILILTTLNRSLKSLLGAKVLAEYMLRIIPMETHSWTKFIKPAELQNLLADFELEIRLLNGISYKVMLNDFILDQNLSMNYAVSAAFRN